MEILERFSGISAPFIFTAAMQMCLEVSSVVTLFYAVITAGLPQNEDFLSESSFFVREQMDERFSFSFT